MSQPTRDENQPTDAQPPAEPTAEGDSRTRTAAHTTAHKLKKQYHDPAEVVRDGSDWATSGDDGYVTSREYAEHWRGMVGMVAARANSPSANLPEEDRGSRGEDRGGGATTPPPSAAGRRVFDLDFHHPLEDWLDRYLVRKLLGYVSRTRRGRQTTIEEVLESYGNPAAPLGQRVSYWPLHKLIDWLRGSTSVETFRQRISEHRATVRGLVATARSVAEFGLMVPQRFSAPLFAVWNFTNRCNLRCQHCYQDSAAQGLADELTLEEKIDLVDQMAAEYVAMIAFAGGEPTISPDLLPVLKRCQQHGMHMSVATNGTTMTPALAGKLAEAGVRYVEISLDSVRAEKHDAFRGQRGMWERSVSGMRHVVAQEGLRLGIAMCVHSGNIDEVEEMLQFAVDIGAGCFAHFNFIPVGRGLEMTQGDITPRQRQWLLSTLNRWMQSGKLGVLSTAPQLGRVSLAEAAVAGRQSCSHAGSGAGWKARVVAKYLGGCGAGRTYVCIEPAGDITPCVYMPHRVLGNIRQRGFREIFRENRFTDTLCDREQLTQHCGVCEFRSYCGGCRARADAYYGSINGGDPGCIFNERHWETLVQEDVVAQAERDGEDVTRPAVRSYDGCTTSWAKGED